MLGREKERLPKYQTTIHEGVLEWTWIVPVGAAVVAAVVDDVAMEVDHPRRHDDDSDD